MYFVQTALSDAPIAQEHPHEGSPSELPAISL